MNFLIEAITKEKENLKKIVQFPDWSIIFLKLKIPMTNSLNRQIVLSTLHIVSNLTKMKELVPKLFGLRIHDLIFQKVVEEDLDSEELEGVISIIECSIAANPQANIKRLVSLQNGIFIEALCKISRPGTPNNVIFLSLLLIWSSLFLHLA